MDIKAVKCERSHFENLLYLQYNKERKVCIYYGTKFNLVQTTKYVLLVQSINSYNSNFFIIKLQRGVFALKSRSKVENIKTVKTHKNICIHTAQ